MPTNPEEISKIYDSRASEYDDSNNSLHIRQTRTYLNSIEPYLYQGASLLDLACGTGLLTIPAKDVVGSQGRVVGIDVSKGMLDIAKGKAQNSIEWYENDVSDLESLNLGYFDVITCASAFVLLPSPKKAIENWARLLKPGGHIMTDVHVPESNVVMEIFTTIGSTIGETLKWDMTYFRKQDDLRKVFEDVGLEIVKIWESEVYGTNVIDIKKAEEIFEKSIQSPMFANFGAEEIKPKARDAFVDKLKEFADDQDTIKEETRYWMCVGRKN